jgi:hypothetical protein
MAGDLWLPMAGDLWLRTLTRGAGCQEAASSADAASILLSC